MTWLKTDDGEGMAPWVFQVGNEAYGVYVRLGSYCAQHLTDGLVPKAMAEMIVGGSKKPLLALEVVGRVKRRETGDVELPFFLDSNPTRAQVEAEREARSTRATAAARKRWGTA